MRTMNPRMLDARSSTFDRPKITMLNGLGTVSTTINSGRRNGMIPKKTALTRPQIAFVEWVRRAHPEIYQAAIGKLTGTSAIGPETSFEGLSGAFDSFISTVKDLGTTYLQIDQQRRILDAQTQRATQGLPPLDANQLAPTVRVEGGLDTNTLMLIGGGLLALLVVPRLLK